MYFITHTHTHTHSVGFLWLRDGPSQKLLPENTQHSQETDIHALGGIHSHKSSKLTAAENLPNGLCLVSYYACIFEYNLAFVSQLVIKIYVLFHYLAVFCNVLVYIRMRLGYFSRYYDFLLAERLGVPTPVETIVFFLHTNPDRPWAPTHSPVLFVPFPFPRV